MKQSNLLAGLVLVLGLAATGCKTAPKMPWSKTAKAEEVTKVAGAPALPSDAAKQANAAQVAGGDAAPYVASQSQQIVRSTIASTPTVGGYPTTSAPAFNPAAATQAAATTTASAAKTAADASANLGAINSPYNPTKVPPAPAGAAAVASTAATTEAPRYGSPSYSTAAAYGTPATSTVAATTAPAYGTPAPSTVAATTAPAAPAYGTAANAVTSYPSPGIPAVNNVATSARTAAASYADPYVSAGTQATSAAQSGYSAAQTSYNAAQKTAAATPSYQAGRYGEVYPTTPTPSTNTIPASPTAQLASSTAAYRPGGTGTYPGTAVAQNTNGAAVKVASRPQTTSATTTNVPNVAVPGTSTTPTYR